ncbi:MAG: L-rhamnonate dehydratase [Thermomicrobiales bacterium]|nr:L-rhamnonate dehydratase [Thermomicrobiales bacterium]
MRITQVLVDRVRKDESKPKSWLSESLVANPMSIYPEYKAKRSSWNAKWGNDLLVRVVTDDGIEGIGGSVPAGARIIIEEHFRDLLTGQDPIDSEKLWDQMFRSSLPYGRKGLAIMAISAIDNALWDIKGKALGQPLYRLLGGKTKDSMPVYSTGNDVAFYHKLGFTGFKLAMPHGPVDGWAGMKANLALIEKTREIVGPDSEIMLDCYMAWNVDYTLRMARACEPYRVRWIEESLPPDDIEGYAEITAKSPVPIATGEHEFTRWGHKELLARRACHILQPDVMWVGGVSEMLKIGAMASAFGIEVIPHGGGLHPWALHLIQAQVAFPMVEWVVVGNEGEENPIRPIFEYLDGMQVPVDGRISAGDAPGAGITLRDGWIEA